jgi:Raf kinase inhibitor-like YbhB/YbcL family protein
MNLSSRSFRHEGAIPQECAFARADPATHVALSENRNPELVWTDLPEATVPDNVNKEGQVVPADLPRADFHHWVMVDIPPTCTSIAAGECSEGVTPHGKECPPNPAGAPQARQGVSDYTGWFADDPQMSGTYLGYDGPAPPWNDERIHRYHFKLYALNLERCPVEGAFTAPEVKKAIEGHVLAEAKITGTYTLNTRLVLP